MENGSTYDTILISEACFHRLREINEISSVYEHLPSMEFYVFNFTGGYYWKIVNKEFQKGELGNQVPCLTFANWVRRFREDTGARFCRCNLIGCCDELKGNY